MPCFRQNGTSFPAEVGLSWWQAGDTASVGAIARNVPERQLREDRQFKLASLDSLTGLPNRTAWHDCLSHAIPSDKGLTLLLFGLDGLEEVNDCLGHFAGDVVLKEVGERLRQTCTGSVIVARLGGDEFVCLLEGDNLHTAQLIARNIVDAVSVPIMVDEHIVQIGVSIQLSFYPPHSSDRNEPVEAADLALYRAMMSGGGRSEIFTPRMHRVALLRRELESELRTAFERGEFKLFYQPQITTAGRKLAGAEALLRWNHPTRGLLSPISFIEVLGMMPLSLSVGRWILETACRDAFQWRQEHPNFCVSVNLFASQFRANLLLPAVQQALADTGLSPSALEVEIVENTLTTQDEPLVSALQELRKMGVRLAFDDYGTGFASLSLLKRYPASRLKIDQTFVRDVAQDHQSAALVKAILYLADVFQMETIAEGIETEDQFSFLAEHGCPQVQGFLFGQPVPADEFYNIHVKPA